MAQGFLPSHLQYRRFLEKEVEQLSDIELLAILLEETPLDQETTTLNLTHQLLEYKLEYKDDLHYLLKLVRAWIFFTQGSRKTNDVSLKVCHEIQRRSLAKVLKKYDALLFSDFTSYFLMSKLHGHTGDMLSGLFLNQLHHMLGFEDLFSGSIDDTNTSLCDTVVKEILENAKRYEATGIIMARNNLSLDASPTSFDISLVRCLINRLSITGVQLLDYWIISEDSSISLRNENKITPL
jgi:DNA repair protein RadC